jgi:hypothetical protein
LKTNNLIVDSLPVILTQSPFEPRSSQGVRASRRRGEEQRGTDSNADGGTSHEQSMLVFLEGRRNCVQTKIHPDRFFLT